MLDGNQPIKAKAVVKMLDDYKTIAIASVLRKERDKYYIAQFVLHSPHVNKVSQSISTKKLHRL